MSNALAATEILARSGEGWKSGPLGLTAILVLCVACYFLFKSMSKHLRRVREGFPVDDAPAAAPLAEPPPGGPQRSATSGQEPTGTA